MVSPSTHKSGLPAEPSPEPCDCGRRDDQRRAALIAFVRLHELGVLDFEPKAAVHQAAGNPSPKGSSGRRPVVRREPLAETAPAYNMGQSVYIQEGESA